ncbi:uncharacterized protein HMPREF1541_10206 [Cyphellophora europaea CBS 101466]|uniref:Ceramide glucosyltransferase n=1 Tax=Cyphellophora europaea (strain CBS 101466) TaxID=1220924 RepID=W2S749_CYPE1|nr:uncharacterized protein HMPREF1541_10206 [Cyphellophora europaea CBS 101466]ETN44536.1 hypothetical protein HMPREF1541_10206 [Cyphellophora europaea CBS 101466]
MYTEVAALLCLGWFFFIFVVCGIGYVQLFRHYRKPPARANVLQKPLDRIPHVTVIRPCKGHEPYLADCLASSFLQDYPQSKLTIQLCVASRSDAAVPAVESVLKRFPNYDARLYVEDEDPALQTADSRDALGPNPKIRNMSRAYREGRGDLVWIIDCNVWVSRGACARMVDTLCGYGPNGSLTMAYKLVHHLPLCIDVHEDYATDRGSRKLLHSMSESHSHHSMDVSSTTKSQHRGFGGRLEELFLSSSHAKMYVAISTVAIAPCIVGKSNMFRRSDLYGLTRGQGLDYFSHNICEDHLIGDLLWKSTIGHQETLSDNLESKGTWRRMGNHGLVKGDLAIQPVAGMGVAGYMARRVRWLRVRKFTVPAATAVEPGTESVVCSLLGAWGLATSSLTRDSAGSTWVWMLCWWLVSMTVWNCVDRTVYLLLHSGVTIEAGDDPDEVPTFARPLAQKWKGRRKWATWFRAWLGREFLAFGIWFWAIWGGVSVTWRERRFWVGLDMKVHEIPDASMQRRKTPNGTAADGKVRVD